MLMLVIPEPQASWAGSPAFEPKEDAWPSPYVIDFYAIYADRARFAIFVGQMRPPNFCSASNNFFHRTGIILCFTRANRMLNDAPEEGCHAGAAYARRGGPGLFEKIWRL
jgi:hypothetical protein